MFAFWTFIFVAVVVGFNLPGVRSKRNAARALRQAQVARLLAQGVCPECSGKPFEQVLMNGLSGCLECGSKGTASAYRACR